MKKAGAIFDRTIGLLTVLAAAIFIFIWLSICTDVFMRYFLTRPLQWTVDLSEYSLLFITFLGAAWLLKEEGHVKLEIVLNRLNPRNQALVNIITSILSAMTCLAVTWWGVTVTWDAFQRNLFDFRQLELPLAPLLAVIPIGSFLLFIQFLRRIFTYLRGRRASLDKEQGL